MDSLDTLIPSEVSILRYKNLLRFTPRHLNVYTFKIFLNFLLNLYQWLNQTHLPVNLFFVGYVYAIILNVVCSIYIISLKLSFVIKNIRQQNAIHSHSHTHSHERSMVVSPKTFVRESFKMED